MGLDSLPNTNLVSKGSAPDLVPRSRSVNFVDYLLKFDVSQDNHHKVKSSASFREVPAPFQKKNHDVLVLYLGSGSEDHKVGSNLRKQEMGLGELRQRKKQGSKNKEIVKERSIVTKERNHGKNKRISKFKNEPIMVPIKHSSKVRNHNEAKVLASVSANSKNCSYRKCSTGSRSRSTLPNKQKKVLSEPKQKKNMRKQQPPKKTETQYSSENFSPSSVLDNNDYQFLYGPDFLGVVMVS
ncbi:hypothetical protein SESBI_41261 [Sesbania bispinosa]|nr:hypothetical protein SESBI_41261 [Sesbania bispinosa]